MTSFQSQIKSALKGTIFVIEEAMKAKATKNLQMLSEALGNDKFKCNGKDIDWELK